MNIFWIRRDIRLRDNAPLHAALAAGKVLPLFIFDTDILDKLDSKADKRVSFIHDRLTRLKKEIESYGGTLLVKHGTPVDVFKALLDEYQVQSVYAGRDYEPSALERDERVASLLEASGKSLKLFKDHVIFEHEEVLKQDRSPYIVYTPYMRAWKKHYLSRMPETHESEKFLQNLVKMKPEVLLTLEEIGFNEIEHSVPEPDLSASLLGKYHEQRDFPFADATSRLGPHLRFGTMSIREIAAMAMDVNAVFLNQIIWRDFFIQILSHFPHTEKKSFREKYDRIPWRNNKDEFARWCEGKTGFPIVDAGMRQLNKTGYMHNRVRMMTANFLTKLLLIDWRWGEDYFAKKLLDYEMANNVGGWQWAAGSGCDAAPYFRIFNPDTQIKKFDPKLDYTREWVEEFDTPDYPQPVIDYRQARERALSVYKSALK